MRNHMLSIFKLAGNAIMEVYADVDRFKTEIKSDHSPLTEADKRSNQIICEALAEYYPGIPVISEETKQAAFEERQKYSTYFLVDPLDGTKEFIKRNGEFTINIAYLEGHSTVAGFVYVPVSNAAFMAEQGDGAWRIDKDDHKAPLTSKQFYLGDQGIKVVASRSHRDPQTEKIIGLLNQPEIVSVGSALKFLLIAEGKANFYPRLAPTMEWDTAAAQCILEEAGGSLLQYETLNPLVYNKPDLLNPYFIAMGACLDPEGLRDILDRVQE